MSNNKVSEKAIWEGAISSDDNAQQAVSHIHTQPQMMFCYKCNNVIPSDSTFCPYCQIKLFAECPKCGANYSSQYPACCKCGTNREEYLQRQRREAERKAAIERESRRQREIEERKILEAKEEKERQERLKRYEQEARERQEQEFIKGTDEFKYAYDYLCELNRRKEEHNKKQDNIIYKRLAIIGVSWILGLAFMNHLPDFINFIIMTTPLWCLLFLLRSKSIHDITSLKKYCPQTKSFHNKLTQEIIDIVSEYIASHNIDLDYIFSKEHFIEEIIKAYKKSGGPTS